VVRTALVESWAVTLVGLLLGTLAAAATFIAVLATTSALAGVATLSLPWAFILAVAACAFLVTGATSVFTTLTATRARPVALLGTRE
jgi:putative ABC transport system permease protein